MLKTYQFKTLKFKGRQS